jgi:serine/threonine protein kinase
MDETIAIEDVSESLVTYEFPSKREKNGNHVPILLGSGKFAKVFEGKRKHKVLGVRRVAIKVLHPHASYRFINLFEQEIRLLSEMGAKHGDGVIVAADIIHINPLVMCRCGWVFTPQCSNGHGPLVTKKPESNQPFPMLICPDNHCDVRISAEHVTNDYGKLFKSRHCCTATDEQSVGNIINFRRCKAIVMDISEHSLDRFVAQDLLPIARSDKSLPLPPNNPNTASPIRAVLDFATLIVNKILSRIPLPPSLSRPPDDAMITHHGERILQKTAIMERIKIMLELAMTVERLHSSEIVHRDLAPDNIMLKSIGEATTTSIAINAQNCAYAKLILAQKLQQPHFKVCLIDFGLADRKKCAREWYDDEQVDRGRDKMAFWSPEASNVRLRVPTSDIALFDPSDPRRANGLLGEIRIRPNSTFEFMQGDIIVDRHDTKYDNAIRIKEVRADGDGSKYAMFSGTLPADYRSAHLEQIPTLGEPHDLFALGALLYHLFVNDTGLTDAFRTFVLQYANKPKTVTVDEAIKDEYYVMSRDRLPFDYWKDEIMIIAMGAMIRGRDGSFAADRTEFTAAPVQRLLWALRRLHLKMMTDLFQELARLPA